MSTFRFEGPIEIWSQEGGYASPVLECGGVDVTAKLEELLAPLAVDPPARSTAEVGIVQGRWEIIVRRID